MSVGSNGRKGLNREGRPRWLFEIFVDLVFMAVLLVLFLVFSGIFLVANVGIASCLFTYQCMAGSSGILGSLLLALSTAGVLLYLLRYLKSLK